jgi:transcriptional regulator of acetoin/glycerol metabolism
MSDDNTISVTDLDLLSFEYTETAEEYPLLEMEKTLSKNPYKNNGNITTAEELGLSRASLYRRLEKFDIKNND